MWLMLWRKHTYHPLVPDHKRTSGSLREPFRRCPLRFRTHLTLHSVGVLGSNEKERKRFSFLSFSIILCTSTLSGGLKVLEEKVRQPGQCCRRFFCASRLSQTAEKSLRPYIRIKAESELKIDQNSCSVYCVYFWTHKKAFRRQVQR